MKTLLRLSLIAVFAAVPAVLLAFAKGSPSLSQSTFEACVASFAAAGVLLNTLVDYGREPSRQVSALAERAARRALVRGSTPAPAAIRRACELAR